MIIKEACVGSLGEALIAQSLGASRIEYCQNLQEGGTTPSYGSLLEGKKLLSIPMMVIIRPRGGDFVYSPAEVNIMKRDIEICKQIGVQGVVLGVLTKDGVIDRGLLQELVALAKPLAITFHMAFDVIKNKQEALEELIALKIDRILTKGCSTNAFDGRNEIKKLVDQSRGRITILPGGGIRETNFQEIVDFTGAKEVHGTKIVGSLSTPKTFYL
jgi:copper homeostasis protein